MSKSISNKQKKLIIDEEDDDVFNLISKSSDMIGIKASSEPKEFSFDDELIDIPSPAAVQDESLLSEKQNIYKEKDVFELMDQVYRQNRRSHYLLLEIKKQLEELNRVDKPQDNTQVRRVRFLTEAVNLKDL